MDLDIAGKSAIVCGASRGLGRACAYALAKEGVNVWMVARNSKVLNSAADELRKIVPDGTEIHTVVADITQDKGRDLVNERCSHPDILVNNAGGPRPGDFRDWRQDEWSEAFNQNFYSSVDFIRRYLDGMIARRFGRIINVTSIAVKLPQPELGLSNGVRSGLTGFVAGIAREPSRQNVTINNVLPGFIETDRMLETLKFKARERNLEFEELRKEFFDTIPAGRAGNPEEFGSVCAFLCSQRAGYITAQNILVDGGLYPGTF